MTDLQDRILSAALPSVVFDGWSMKTLERAAESAGLPAVDAHRAFPGGVIECLDYFTSEADRHMAESLAQDYALSEMKIRERIATAIMVRLRQNQPHREAIRRAAAYYSLPWNAPAMMRSAYQTLDTIWRICGDTSTDFNFYTKRALLAKVYASTLYVWLNDDSPDLAETQAFLHRRIDNVMQIQKAKFKAKEWLSSSMFFNRSSSPRS